MSPRISRVLRLVGYPLFYLAALVIFTYLSLPMSRLRDRVVAELAVKRPLGETKIEIDELSTYWLSGVRVHGMRLTSPPPPPGEDGKQDKPKVATIDDLHCRVSLFRWLFGTLRVECAGKAFGGEISGAYTATSEKKSIEFELSSLNVADLPLVQSTVGLPMTGALSGSAELSVPEGKLAKAEGKLTLSISDLSVGDGKAKVRDTIALPKLEIGALELVAEAAEGRLKVTKFAASGHDLELACEGRIKLRDPVDNSLAELTARFKFSDKYTDKNDVTRAIFGAPGSKIAGVFDLDPKNKRAKRPDGFYAWRVSGPLGHMIFEPAPAGAAGAPGGMLQMPGRGMKMPLGGPPKVAEPAEE